MQYRALYRYADSSARKVRYFADLVRGRPADEALELLSYLPNRGARLMEQVIKSAIGNAEDRGARDATELVASYLPAVRGLVEEGYLAPVAQP